MSKLSRVHVFVEVAKQQSFSGAGRCLGLTGPAVSKQVQALESELGVKLLHRTTRNVSLTEEGAVYFERARNAIEDLLEAEQQLLEMKECPAGKLKINAPMSFGNQYLVAPITDFANLYPEVELEVDFDDRWVDVIAEGFDVVVRIGVLEDSSLIARRLADCPIYLCASPDFIKQYGEPQSANELCDMPAVIYSKHQVQEDWHYADQSKHTGSVKLNGVFSANTAEMQLGACLSGIGLAVLPVFTANPHLKSGALKRLLPQLHTSPERGIYALFPQNRHLSTRVRLFVDHLTQACAGFSW